MVMAPVVVQGQAWVGWEVVELMDLKGYEQLSTGQLEMSVRSPQ